MPLSRREFIRLMGSGSLAVAAGACGRSKGRAIPIEFNDPAVAAAEARRRRAGAAVREVPVTAAPFVADLGGLSADTWAYNGALPGPEVRIRAGEVLRVPFTNNLTDPTTIHWHGLSLRNDMDGVPDLTQPSVAPGATFAYEFTVPDPGTFWFHPHVDLQLDRGLYVPLIVEDPNEPGAYDQEITVVLDDWTDGLGTSPAQNLEDLRQGRGAHAEHMAMSGSGGPAGPRSEYLASAPGDVSYPLFLINGRRPSSPVTFAAKPGERLRLRIVNAGSDTPFRVAVGGHQMTVTHTDGFPVEPVKVDTLVVAMAERYDVLVTVKEAGVFPLVAVAEAKGNQALAVIRAGEGDTPPANARPAELNGRVLDLADLHAAPAVRLPPGRPDRTITAELGGGDEGYVWTINGTPNGDKPLEVRQGERVRLSFRNTTTMFHPMHLHGHTFEIVLPSGAPGARKDTTIVRPNQPLSVDFLADNPGQWMLHCHNAYHQTAGMVTTVSYVTDRRT